MSRTRKVVLMLLTILLLFSSTSVLLGRAQTLTGSLQVAPNPVGYNQEVLVVAFTQPLTEDVECIIEATEPDGSYEFIGPLVTNNLGVASVTYVPDQIGTYMFRLFLDGDEIASDTEYLTVQEEPVPPTSAVPVVPGYDVMVYPDPEDDRISLHFEEITSVGIAAVSQTAEPPGGVPPLRGILTDYFDFEVNFAFAGVVTVGLPYDEAELKKCRRESWLTMWHYEEGLVGDVNEDGKVDCRDLRIIIHALGSKPGSRRWNSACDLNGDGRVTGTDLVMAMRNLRQADGAWVNVTSYVDTNNNIVYGTTSSFPPFGIRYR